MNFGKSILTTVLAGFALSGFAAMELKEADITTVKNIVERNEGSGAVPAKVNDKVTEKSVVSTAAASMAELTFADSSITRMGSNTQFSFKSKERLVKLEQGTVLIHTPPGNGGATVEAGGVTAAVTGTTFMASRDGVGNVLFILLEGQGGLKVTAGGSTTVIRPGQAASVGAESVKELAAAPSSEKSASAPAAGSSTPGGDEKGPGRGSAAAPATGGDSGGAAPAPAPAPKIQVFDIDVKRVVTTSPLVVDFKAELPSASKIEKTVETQQQAVKEGKLEKLEVEAVAVKSGDGDLLVGAPKVEKEEFVIVNKKMDVVGKAQGGDGLDIETAAGPGAGPGTGGGMAAAPRVEAPQPRATLPTIVPPVNPAQTALQPVVPAKVAVTAVINNASRSFNEDNPAFGFSITSGRLLAGHSLVSDFLTSATPTSGVSGSPYVVNFLNPRIVNASGIDVTNQYDLTTVAGVLNVLRASPNLVFGTVPSLLTGSSTRIPVSGVQAASAIFSVVEADGRAAVDSLGNLSIGRIFGAGSFTLRATVAGDSNYLGGSVDVTIPIARDAVAIEAANPARRLLKGPDDPAELEAFDNFFYYTAKASDFTGDAPGSFFGTDHQSKTFSLSQLGVQAQPIALYQGQTSVYFAMGSLNAGTETFPTVNPPAGNTVVYADSIRLGSANPSGTLPLNWLSLVDSTSSWNVPDGTAVGNFQQLNAAWSYGGLPLAARLNLAVSPLPTDSVGANFYLGDYTAYLRHTTADGETRTVRLFDRIGATATDPSGSPANRLIVTLSDWESANINAQETAGTLTGSLTGSYRPDYGGWPISLNDLVSIDPNGSWTLFVADLAGGGVGRVEDWSLDLAPVFQPQQTISLGSGTGAERLVTFASGDAGTVVLSTRWLAGDADMEFLSSGALDIRQTQFESLGSKFTVEATGKVSLGAAPTASLEVADREQVRILADTVTDAGSGNPVAAPGSLAVIRSGNSLELRNVTIRSFADSKLETVSGGVTTGRVLMSGSSVRDFKIKELVGAAVNADSKIQMAALDALGGLEGEMLVEKGLPVAKISVADSADLRAKLGTTELSEMMNDPRRRDVKVDASQVDLAARKITFDNASVAALNSITARANTIVVQNSFMTVMRNSGMINMYVQTGRVNPVYGQEAQGYANFIGRNVFQVGNTSIVLNNSYANDLGVNQLGTNLLDVSHHNGTPQAGKVNVLKL